MKKSTTNRRGFLKKVGLAAAAVTAAPITARSSAKVETIKMLTPDGKLVEVSKTALANATKKKVNNKDILNWITYKG